VKPCVAGEPTYGTSPLLRVAWPDASAKHQSLIVSESRSVNENRRHRLGCSPRLVTIAVDSHAVESSEEQLVRDAVEYYHSTSNLHHVLNVNIHSYLYGSFVAHRTCVRVPVVGCVVSLSVTIGAGKCGHLNQSHGLRIRIGSARCEDDSDVQQLWRVDLSTCITVTCPKHARIRPSQHTTGGVAVGHPLVRRTTRNAPAIALADNAYGADCRRTCNVMIRGSQNKNWAMRSAPTGAYCHVNDMLHAHDFHMLLCEANMASLSTVTSVAQLVPPRQHQSKRVRYMPGPPTGNEISHVHSLISCVWVDWSEVKSMSTVDPVSLGNLIIRLITYFRHSPFTVIPIDTTSASSFRPTNSFVVKSKWYRQFLRLREETLHRSCCWIPAVSLSEVVLRREDHPLFEMSCKWWSARKGFTLHTVRRLLSSDRLPTAVKFTTLAAEHVALADVQLELRVMVLCRHFEHPQFCSAEPLEAFPDSCNLGMRSPNVMNALEYTQYAFTDTSIVSDATAGSNVVVGCTVEKGLLREMVMRKGHESLFSQLGLRSTGGILLFGPPGCSKTLLARSIAHESNRHLISVQGPQFTSKWLGESERAIRKVFSLSQTKAPSIIFVDEIDSVASKRDDCIMRAYKRDVPAPDRRLTQLLVEIERAVSSDVIVVAASNRPDRLDPALLRPGRLDRLIYCRPPDKTCLEKLLSHTLPKRMLPHEIDPRVLPRIAGLAASLRFSGAEAVGMVRAAAFSAIEDDSPTLCPEHLESALSDMKPASSPRIVEFYESWHKFAQGL